MVNHHFRQYFPYKNWPSFDGVGSGRLKERPSAFQLALLESRVPYEAEAEPLVIQAWKSGRNSKNDVETST
jgi:hypothetical protein